VGWMGFQFRFGLQVRDLGWQPSSELSKNAHYPQIMSARIDYLIVNVGSIGKRGETLCCLRFIERGFGT
jgi:hypothetical protein